MRKLSLIVIFLLMSGSASASFFSDLTGFFQPHKALQQSVTPAMQMNNYDNLMASLYKLNTPQLISVLNQEMAKNEINSVKIHITDMNKDFYVVKNRGVTETPQRSDVQISMSSKRIQEIIPIVQDGKIDILEWIQLQAIYYMRESP